MYRLLNYIVIYFTINEDVFAFSIDIFMAFMYIKSYIHTYTSMITSNEIVITLEHLHVLGSMLYLTDRQKQIQHKQ
jgi:hypothetical protein